MNWHGTTRLVPPERLGRRKRCTKQAYRDNPSTQLTVGNDTLLWMESHRCVSLICILVLLVSSVWFGTSSKMVNLHQVPPRSSTLCTFDDPIWILQTADSDKFAESPIFFPAHNTAP